MDYTDTQRLTGDAARDLLESRNLAEARARAGAFPVAPLAMPEQDMSPASLSLRLTDLLPAVLRRLVQRDGVIRH